jgi:hypothetical protein
MNRFERGVYVAVLMNQLERGSPQTMASAEAQRAVQQMRYMALLPWWKRLLRWCRGAHEQQ